MTAGGKARAAVMNWSTVLLRRRIVNHEVKAIYASTIATIMAVSTAWNWVMSFPLFFLEVCELSGGSANTFEGKICHRHRSKCRAIQRQDLIAADIARVVVQQAADGRAVADDAGIADYYSKFTDVERAILRDPETLYIGLAAARARAIADQWRHS